MPNITYKMPISVDVSKLKSTTNIITINCSKLKQFAFNGNGEDNLS